MTTLGIALIGQAPRPELAALFARFVPAGTEIVMRGCLDDLDRAGIAAVPPRDGHDALYSKLPSGESVTISKAAVIAGAPAALERLRGDGADALVFNCTGAFPPIPGDAGVLFPSRLLAGIAAGLVPQGRIGLFVPLAEQRGKLDAKWARPGVEIVSEALSPAADAAETDAAAQRLAAERPDLVVFDCMSYRPETRALARPILGCPTLLAVTAVGAILAELLA